MLPCSGDSIEFNERWSITLQSKPYSRVCGFFLPLSKPHSTVFMEKKSKNICVSRICGSYCGKYEYDFLMGAM
jgi:hypothetical protein